MTSHLNANLLKLGLSLATALAPFAASAEILELKSYRNPEVAAELKALATESVGRTWVIFDIDNTLLYPDSMIGSHQWGDYMRDQTQSLGVPRAEAEEVQHFAFNSIQGHAPMKVTEAEVFSVISELTRLRVPTFALTARREIIAPVTLSQVQTAGFKFDTTFPKLAQTDPSVHEGLVFSGTTPKGILLKQLISESVVKPTRIVFFDDKRYNLESVEKEMDQAGIEFVGYRYGAMDETVAGFRGDLANVEWVEFKRTGRLLSDREAQKLIFSK